MQYHKLFQLTTGEVVGVACQLHVSLQITVLAAKCLDGPQLYGTQQCGNKKVPEHLEHLKCLHATMLINLVMLKCLWHLCLWKCELEGNADSFCIDMKHGILRKLICYPQIAECLHKQVYFHYLEFASHCVCVQNQSLRSVLIKQCSVIFIYLHPFLHSNFYHS